MSKVFAREEMPLWDGCDQNVRAARELLSKRYDFELIKDSNHKVSRPTLIYASRSNPMLLLGFPPNKKKISLYLKEIGTNGRSLIRHISSSEISATYDNTGKTPASSVKQIMQPSQLHPVYRVELSFDRVIEVLDIYVELGTSKPLPAEVMVSIGEIDSQDEYCRTHLIDSIQWQAIKSRRGQPAFRKALIAAFNGQCCISGSRVLSVLEAAHIIPHNELTDYSVHNGLLLRADLHTLFDLNLVRIDSEGIVLVDSELDGSEYQEFNEKKITNCLSDRMRSNLAERIKLKKGLDGAVVKLLGKASVS